MGKRDLTFTPFGGHFPVWFFSSESRESALLFIAAFIFCAELLARTELRVAELLVDDFPSDISALGTH